MISTTNPSPVMPGQLETIQNTSKAKLEKVWVDYGPTARTDENHRTVRFLIVGDSLQEAMSFANSGSLSQKGLAVLKADPQTSFTTIRNDGLLQTSLCDEKGNPIYSQAMPKHEDGEPFYVLATQVYIDVE